jgi:hypothetical protein
VHMATQAGTTAGLDNGHTATPRHQEFVSLTQLGR